MSELNEFLKVRLEKLKALKEKGINPYPSAAYEITQHSKEVLEKHQGLQAGEHQEDEKVSMAGRLMTIRDMGKSCFAHLQDSRGRIQVYVRKDSVAKSPMKSLNCWIWVTSSASRAFPLRPKPGK